MKQYKDNQTDEIMTFEEVKKEYNKNILLYSSYDMNFDIASFDEYLKTYFKEATQ